MSVRYKISVPSVSKKIRERKNYIKLMLIILSSKNSNFQDGETYPHHYEKY